ncbi:EAL domain-containing protein [Idiomarina aminovorans]|uniref:EAL domain-containing protein n=1 Tax=Idiomarina aminovorans TaxID=2914829 RepID=UPI0020039F1C|nr:EAL domain-containing protein [Idiomarina sp. ATCH4]MCK7458914.1 EAL domain-containing protein [Idiomarina sp. ATCH4]
MRNLFAILDLDIIAEGVETEAHLNKLQQMGCFCYQGYYFARPELISYWLNTETFANRSRLL